MQCGVVSSLADGGEKLEKVYGIQTQLDKCNVGPSFGWVVVSLCPLLTPLWCGRLAGLRG